MTSDGWFFNEGDPPIFVPLRPDQPCPKHLIHHEVADTARVYVELRSGRRPEQSWPVYGRPLKTRWRIDGDDWDIKKWRRA